MEDTFAQIDGAAEHSLANVGVSITSGGSIVGQGVTASPNAVNVCGGNLDNILRSFGGIEGGDMSFGGKAAHAVKKSSALGSKLHNHLEKELTHVHEQASDLEALAAMAKSALKHAHDSEDARSVLEKIVAHVDVAARDIRGTVDNEVKAPKQKVSDFIERNGQFVRAIKSLGAHLDESSMAGMLSLSFTSVNELKKIAKEVSGAIKTVGLTKSKYFGSSLSQLDKELTSKLAGESKKMSTSEMKEFLSAWSTLMQAHGHQSEFQSMVGGALGTNTLVERLTKSRTELKNMINKFIDSFAHGINAMVDSTEKLSKELGGSVDYDEPTVLFLESFKSLNEYLDQRSAKLYQYLLELNQDTQIDSKEVKERFLSTMKILSERADAMDKVSATKSFATACRSVIETVNKFNDIIKTHRDETKGGSTDSMNELFSVDAAKIDIVGIMTPLDNLKTAIKKLDFYRNIAIFRSNLNQTNKELALYTKDYSESVGKAIGEAITKIRNEYTDIINQISDNKVGMGLEIDMYNESADKNQRISKEKLKQIYKWQCDARIGLYKTIEAIDMYLLHFTETVTKNPDAVSDLHKMLTATKIISKWYDQKAGDNIVRLFESFRDNANAVDVDDGNFMSDYANGVMNLSSGGQTGYADIDAARILGPKANQLYERCRRAVEGVVVLKNIISYFISISEKYGNFKDEKNIYMAPSNIYKNLVNYIWVSAIDVGTIGTEVLTDNNETKRLLSYQDTAATLAKAATIDPNTMGINFNKHSIDKLRILKCHNDLLRLRDFTASFDESDMQRVKQFVRGVFARLGKTEYIYEMARFGVYDLSTMNKNGIKNFLQYLLKTMQTNGARQPSISVSIGGQAGIAITDPTVNGATNPNLPSLIAAIPANRRNDPSQVRFDFQSGQYQTPQERALISIDTFMSMSNSALTNAYKNLMGMDGLFERDGALGDIPLTDLDKSQNAFTKNESPGVMKNFLTGLLGQSNTANKISIGQRTVHALHYCIMQMLNNYHKTQSNSVFMIDDTYFVLTIKAIAGKVMAVTGVNAIFKKPSHMRNALTITPTRLIMGGAEEEIIDEAVELYVRLPLLVEFYRKIFEDGNKAYKNESVTEALDEERITLVPEIGNVWSGLLLNIFDKSKHIDSGLYTQENIAKIIAEINSIYKHFKGSVPNDQLVRHVMVQLVAEVNRRYGIIKRQDLQEYYKVTRAAKSTDLQVGELHYTNNDLDILDESIEFEEKAPSDEFIKFKSTIMDPNTPVEVKINKLTDYRILKNFREQIQTELNAGAANIALPGAVLTLVDRIRSLKKAVVLKSSKTDKYDMIIKAIEESNAMNQSSNDIFMCFHEFVLVPLRTAYQMHRALELFILNMYLVVSTAGNTAAGYASIRNHPILQTQVKVGANTMSMIDAMRTLVDTRRGELLSTDRSSVKIGGLDGFATFNRAARPDASTLTFHQNALGTEGGYQTLAMRALLQFVTNSGDLAKINISNTKRIALDLSEFQKTCEYLVANSKYMIDKFTGLVPTELINLATSVADQGIFSLEDSMIRKMFNKANKSEKDRDLICIDNLYKLMPVVSDLIFKEAITATSLLNNIFIHKTINGTTPFIGQASAKPIIRDSFMQYNAAAKTFLSPADNVNRFSGILFNPKTGAYIGSNSSNGLLQEFNGLIANYMNDLYDAQSRKIYTKAFANFAGSALVDALNGQSFNDFAFDASATNRNMGGYHMYPDTQVVLSSTLAYVMKVMSNRVNPITGMKIHEVATLQEVSSHVMEKYRSLIPMYLRIFKAFLARCKLYRKLIGHVQVVATATPMQRFNGIINGIVKENESDAPIQFVNDMNILDTSGANGAAATKSMAGLYIDEIVNGLTSLIQDATAVQKELLETDSTVSLYFDVKRDFTKNYYLNNKEYPFAPLSIMAMGYAQAAPTIPLYSSDIINNRFTYGLRCMLSDDFKINSTKVPYLKQLISEFNGYTTKTNNISEAKFNDVLQHVGKAASFIYDLRFFNGLAASKCDMLGSALTAPQPLSGSTGRALADGTNPPIVTFQERNPKSMSISLIESVNAIDSRNTIADYVKSLAGANLGALPSAPAASNPRSIVMMVNLNDLNIMPINVHSLMREIPLANIYNYSMTFDAIVANLTFDNNEGIWRQLLLTPYAGISLSSTRQLDIIPNQSGYRNASADMATIASSTNMRFIKDVMFGKILRESGAAGAAGAVLTPDQFNQRTKSKLFHNLMFLSLVQYAIKSKVKSELDFINTRVVENTNAISNIITNASDPSLQDATNPSGTVNDDLFEF